MVEDTARVASGLSQVAFNALQSCESLQLRSIRRSVPSSMYQSLVNVALYYRGWITVMRQWLSLRSAFLTVSSHLYRPTQRCSSVDRRSSSLGAYYRYSRQFSLAPSTRAHQVQTGDNCVPSSSRHCTQWLK